MQIVYIYIYIHHTHIYIYTYTHTVSGWVKLLHSLKIFDQGLILPPLLNFYIHWRSSVRVFWWWWWWWCWCVACRGCGSGQSGKAQEFAVYIIHTKYYVFLNWKESLYKCILIIVYSESWKDMDILWFQIRNQLYFGIQEGILYFGYISRKLM